MRILFVCHRWPFPPKRGGKIRPFNIISHLARNHDVTVASLVRSDEEREEGAGLRDYCSETIEGSMGQAAAWARMIGRLPTSTPSSMGYFYSPELRRAVREAVDKQTFDLVFVHCSSVAQYVADIRGVPKILDFGDMDSQKWLAYRKHQPFPLSLGYLLEGVKLEREEKRLAQQFDLCTCTTRQEFETLEAFDTGTELAWFPNGVDHKYFHPSDKPAEAGVISFVGRMDYYPNQLAVRQFCAEVFPRIRARREGAEFVVIGANPSKEIRRLSLIDGVTVTGSVPDVRPHVWRSAVNVAPLTIARGTQNKILEAMAMGVPVISSSLAASGVDAISGEHLMTADTPEDVAECTIELLDDSRKRCALAAAGRERVISNHDWKNSMSRLDTILEDFFIRYQERRTADTAGR